MACNSVKSLIHTISKIERRTNGLTMGTLSREDLQSNQFRGFPAMKRTKWETDKMQNCNKIHKHNVLNLTSIFTTYTDTDAKQKQMWENQSTKAARRNQTNLCLLCTAATGKSICHPSRPRRPNMIREINYVYIVHVLCNSDCICISVSIYFIYSGKFIYGGIA